MCGLEVDMPTVVSVSPRAKLTANAAAEVLRKIRPAAPTGRTRRVIAWDLVREIRSVDSRLDSIATQKTDGLADYDSQLLEVDGIRPVLAVRLIGRTGPASRLRSSDAFASCAGVAPIEVSSGERVTHRLSRSGDRKLDSTLHLIATTQVRVRNSAGRRCFQRKIDEGKTRNEAMRCLKRKIAADISRRMLADKRHRRATQNT